MKKIITICTLCFLSTQSFSQFPIFDRPCGIYVLGSAQAGIQANAIRPYPFIDGLAMRMKWKDIEPTQGVYDFSIIDTAVSQLQTNGQKLTLALFLKDPPIYIPLLPNAETYWAHETSSPNDSTLNILPWDTVSLPYVNALLNNLASHLVADQSQGGVMVQFKDHPVFSQFAVSLPGLGGIRDTDNDITGHLSYNRTKFTNSAITTIQTSLSIFPNQYHYIAFFGITDGITNPKNLKNHLLDEFNLAFNSGTQPLLGYFAENLACSSPSANSNQVLFSQKNTTFTMMQMLESWRTPHLNNGAATIPCLTDTTGPDIGMTHALNNFNTTYFEIYLNDIEWIQYNNLFTLWQDSLQILCGQTVLSINDFSIDKNNSFIHPNPVSENFEINSSKLFNSIEIYSYSGVLIKKYKLAEVNQFKVNVSDLSSSIYFIKVINGSNVIDVIKMLKN